LKHPAFKFLNVYGGAFIKKSQIFVMASEFCIMTALSHIELHFSGEEETVMFLNHMSLYQ
jgi:hypothetical protein